MSWFRRGKQDDEPDGPEDLAEEAAGAEETDEATEGAAEAAVDEPQDVDRPGAQAETPDDDLAGQGDRAGAAGPRAGGRGPFDESEEDDDLPRVDLGALRIPVREGMELRLEIEEQTQRVVAATLTLAGSSVQVQAFAAPRTAGVWDDIRAEIADSVTRQGGTADEVPGSLGRELLARLPARMPDGRSGQQVVRFTGVDGPRWFLRAVFHGPAAVDEEAASQLEELVCGTVVVRGKEAMAPRDLLALQLPVAGQAPGADVEDSGEGGHDPGDGDDAQARRRRLPDPLQRGPEITEIG